MTVCPSGRGDAVGHDGCSSSVDRVVTEWQAHGRPRQQGIRWPRERWLATFPESAHVLASLPDYLDRPTTRAACLGAPGSPTAASHAFVAVMAWGSGAVGYGPWRTARILQTSVDAPDRLVSVAQRLAEAGALDAYGLLGGDCRLRWLGPAFGTKYLYFCPQSPADPQALILDRLVARWLARHVDRPFNSLSWSSRRYRRYLDLVGSWADALGVAPDDVEWCIFQAESDQTRNQWAATPTTVRQRRTKPGGTEAHDVSEGGAGSL
jgi:hypothetical protein